MQNLKISVITPSYNQGGFIEETIQSILNQNYPNLEYIIIDGGSTDNSVDIIRKYETQLAYWVSEKDRGQSEAINKGFKKATGDIVCWLNSDDILMPNALQNVADYFAENEDMDMVNGQLVLIDQDSNIISNHLTLPQKKWYAQHGVYYISQPSMFWRRKIFEKTGFLKEDFHASMDKEFLIRVFQNDFKVGYLNKLLAGFRLHNTSKSSAGNENKAFIRDTAELVKMYGTGYGAPKPPVFYKTIYHAEKLLRGIYLNKWLFTKKWKGRSVKELNSQNCYYL